MVLAVPVKAPTIVLTTFVKSDPSVARTGFRSRESRTSEIMRSRVPSRASRRTSLGVDVLDEELDLVD